VKKRKREKKTYGIIFNLEELNNNIDISTTEIDDSGRNIYLSGGIKTIHCMIDFNLLLNIYK